MNLIKLASAERMTPNESNQMSSISNKSDEACNNTKQQINILSAKPVQKCSAHIKFRQRKKAV